MAILSDYRKVYPQEVVGPSYCSCPLDELLEITAKMLDTFLYTRSRRHTLYPYRLSANT